MIDADAWAGAALPIVALGLLGVAALRAPGVRHARVTREGGTAFLGERVMHLGYGAVDAMARAAIRMGLSATAVSWISLLLGLIAGLLVARGWLGAAAWVLALSGLCDGVDGAVARLQGTASRAGAVLDSVLDRYVEFFFFAGLGLYFRDSPGAQLLVVLALFGGFMVTYSTAKAEALQVTPPRGWMKRSERLVWLAGGATLAAAARLVSVASPPLLLAAVGVIAVFANISAIRRLRALARAV